MCKYTYQAHLKQVACPSPLPRDRGRPRGSGVRVAPERNPVPFLCELFLPDQGAVFSK
jgi:hypothetical protein